MSTYRLPALQMRRIVVLFSQDEVDAVDRFGMDMGSRSRADAIRRLVREASAKYLDSPEKNEGAASVAADPRHVTNQPQ